jgi:small subunit ribosomal protein S6
MHYYETLYILNPSLTEDEYKGLVSKYAAAVEKNGGVVIDVAEWGKRSLAYAVKKFYTGFYVLLQYCGDAGSTEVLQHEMRLEERVLKFQTVKLKSNVDPEQIKAEKKTPVKGKEEQVPAAPVSAGAEASTENTHNTVEGEHGNSN